VRYAHENFLPLLYSDSDGGEIIDSTGGDTPTYVVHFPRVSGYGQHCYDIENGADPQQSRIETRQRALEAAGVERRSTRRPRQQKTARIK
jgi:hypothetical protein